MLDDPLATNPNHQTPHLASSGARSVHLPSRIAIAVGSLVAAALLAVPPASEPAPVTWTDLIAPLSVGATVTRGYVLSPPRRGESHDVVFVARRAQNENRAAGRIEIHIVDRGLWPGVLESSSFGMAWEVPPPGATITASVEDSTAVTRALYEAVAANDSGFASVDSIPLNSEPAPPLISRVLDRLEGTRGIAVTTLTVAAVAICATVPGGAAAVAVFLFALGLALRMPALDLPFAHDQDVQRMLTGNTSLHEIATGAGLRDRHPPLYFFILHAAQRFGQSEAIGRAPAVFTGALIGPAILLAVGAVRRRIGVGALLIALAMTISPQLIARSREVSEIPLYALLVIAASTSLVAAAQRASSLTLLSLASSHALALFTYYLAPFLVAAHTALLFWWRPSRRVTAAFAAGIIVGSPALILGFVTLLRDWSAREVARAFPALAWGEHSPLQMAALMTRIATDTIGTPLLALAIVASIIGLLRRDAAVVAAALATAATFVGIALLSPIARVQGYYISTVIPLAAMTIALLPEPTRPTIRAAWSATIAVAIVAGLAPLLPGARTLYLPDADAFMPRFAAAIARRPEERIVTVAHYDKTLLAYYLARAGGHSISWDNWNEAPKRTIDVLAMAHSLKDGSEAALGRRLELIIAEGPALIVERDALLLPSISARLSRCEPLEKSPTARLVRCAPS